MEPVSLEAFLKSLQPVGSVQALDPATRADLQKAADAIQGLGDITRSTLADLIHEHPEWVPVLADCCRLSREKLKSALRHGLGTEGWVTLARQDPAAIIDLLDEQFDLVAEVAGQRTRTWSFADVLVERQSARSNAAGTVSIGRILEDQVEELVASIGLACEMRTEFVGRGGRRGPADVAIPAGGDAAEIVVAIKSFGSTGSKQTDAAREFEEMADVRDRQFAFAFCDGIGWLRRKADLARVLKLWSGKRINGVYNLSTMGEFEVALVDAGRRVGLLPPG